MIDGFLGSLGVSNIFGASAGVIIVVGLKASHDEARPALIEKALTDPPHTP